MDHTQDGFLESSQTNIHAAVEYGLAAAGMVALRADTPTVGQFVLATDGEPTTSHTQSKIIRSALKRHRSQYNVEMSTLMMGSGVNAGKMLRVMQNEGVLSAAEPGQFLKAFEEVIKPHLEFGKLYAFTECRWRFKGTDVPASDRIADVHYLGQASSSNLGRKFRILPPIPYDASYGDPMELEVQISHGAGVGNAVDAIGYTNLMTADFGTAGARLQEYPAVHRTVFVLDGRVPTDEADKNYPLPKDLKTDSLYRKFQTLTDEVLNATLELAGANSLEAVSYRATTGSRRLASVPGGASYASRMRAVSDRSQAMEEMGTSAHFSPSHFGASAFSQSQTPM